MKNELKEILDNLRKYANEGGEHKLMEYEIKHIQCYITNLQTIEQQYSVLLSENAELQGKVMKSKDELEKQRREYQETYKDVRIEFKEKDKEIDRLNNVINDAKELMQDNIHLLVMPDGTTIYQFKNKEEFFNNLFDMLDEKMTLNQLKEEKNEQK